MAMGMTPEQFYEGHTWLTVSYRAADLIRRKRANFDAYLMGCYVYDAIGRLAPIFNPFAKAKPEPVMEEPFDLFGERKREAPKSRARTAFEAFAIAHNKAMERKQAGQPAE